MEKGEKANLRRKCHRNFKFEGGILYYRTSSAKQEESKKENEDGGWRVCVQTKEERERIMESCHAGVGGLWKAHISYSRMCFSLFRRPSW